MTRDYLQGTLMIVCAIASWELAKWGVHQWRHP